MTIWALSDPHLAFGAPDKSMEVFGPRWKDYPLRIEKQWKELVKDDDLVLIPGDISWAHHLDKAIIDLEWIHALPGTKVLLKGNHDSWWASTSKLEKAMPSSIHVIHNNAYNWKGVSIAGSRMWDSYEYTFDEIIPTGPKNVFTEEEIESAEKVFQRELGRLEMSLRALDQKANHRIALTHYPPIGLELKPTRISALLEKYNVDICIFGHLHGIKEECINLFGTARGIRYILAAADFIDFKPIKILDN